MMSDTTTCYIPPPFTKNESYYNTITKETLYVITSVDVYEIGILFDYEIHHSKDVSISGDDINGGLIEEQPQLEELEIYMISQFWTDALLDDDMRYESSNNNNQNCTGLVIGTNETSTTEIDEIGEASDILYDDETRLLGISYMPLDYVNLDGCAQQHSTTCTSIRGQVNVAYSGMNEYGVIQTVILRLWDGMENRSFIPPLWQGHDVQLVFLGAGDAVPVSNNGQSISIDSASVLQAANEEDDGRRNNLSKYGLLFVCFVAILGTGTFAAMYVRYKRRLRRKKGMIQAVDENDYNNSIEGEVQRQGHHDDVTTTAPSSRSPTPSIIYDTPSNVLNEVDVSVVSGEIEVNLPFSPIVVPDDDVATTTSTRKK